MPRISLKKREFELIDMAIDEIEGAADWDSPDCAYHEFGDVIDGLRLKLSRVKLSEIKDD